MGNDSRRPEERGQRKERALPDSVEVIELKLREPRLIKIRGIGGEGRRRPPGYS